MAQATSDNPTTESEPQERIHNQLLEHFHREEIETERRINKISLRVSIGVSLVIIANLLILGRHKNYMSNQIGYTVFALYHLILAILLKKDIYSPYFKYLTNGLNVIIVTQVIVGYCIATSWVHGLRSVTLFFYFITIALSGLYYLPRVPIFVCSFASIQYTALFFYSVYFTETEISPMETFTENTISWDILAVVVPLFLIVGFLISYLTKRFREMAKQTLENYVEMLFAGRMFHAYLNQKEPTVDNEKPCSDQRAKTTRKQE